MNEKLKQYGGRFKAIWSERPLWQKASVIGGVLLLIILLSVMAYRGSNPSMVTLYSNLTPEETGQIKSSLDAKGVPSEISGNGTAIQVPKDRAEALTVELASEGIPESGNIDYGFFGEQMGLGMTENEFQMVKLESMQNELASLMTSIESIEDAKVMITIPESSVWVNETEQPASASIVLNVAPGASMDQASIDGLYHLVSKSVPNLPTENIVIMDQNFARLDMKGNDDQSLVSVSDQLSVKKAIEDDIKNRVQQMLGMLIGYNRVVTTVTADIDFTQENRTENLVVPVNEEDMEGIQLSVERITETFEGEGAGAGGIDGTGATDIPNYAAAGNTGTGDYERIEERINNDVSRIQKNIVESPYQLQNLGIQVLVDPTIPGQAGETLPEAEQAQLQEDITQILTKIIRTSLPETVRQEQESDISENISVAMQPFNGRVDFEGESVPFLPQWAIYVMVGLGLLLLVLLVVLLRRRKQTEEFEEEFVEGQVDNDEELEELVVDEGTVKRRQLEKLASDSPEDFAKLLRSWLSEE
ncbi:flagellar M-ring protein FliF [Aureibacillus halotolerans]|uniref:Flagellar M-ring protein n=2 Tax=Aureibacillus halotolerans TaxID=1508390 RepID=A0A4R6U594_9BACI|nr:flagellar basal-body MS-ring/collar protein FliF [Aureibacillus halotolerans]TDQ39645.1 flagellar M-ring protein FliF [Aureibacillus halotolerans]